MRKLIRKSRKINRRKILPQILDPQAIQNVLLNSTIINDVSFQFSDLSNTINKLEQNMKKFFAEQRTALINKYYNSYTSSFEMLTVRNL